MSESQETFEEAFERFRQLVNRLEEGGLSLEDAIATFERGVAASRTCAELLTSAQLRVTRIAESATPDALDLDA